MALIKIKQTKKRWVFSLMSFNTTSRIDIITVISVCSTYCKHANNHIFHFRYYYFESRMFFRFLTRPLLFFLTVNGSFFGGAPCQDCTWLMFFHPCTTSALDAFLKKRMALTTWKSKVKCWKHSRNFYVKVTVNESWWKIKFTKQQKTHQLVFLLLLNLNKLYLL